MLAHIFGNRRLHGCRNKEVLLLQAQLLARIVIVIGIENLHNIPCKILLLHSLAVIPLIKGVQTEPSMGSASQIRRVFTMPFP